MTTRASTPYVLGHADAEHDRLLRQAARFAPFTERLFRDAGIGPGQRVLDVGAGVGDVSLLAARLVGPAGEVTGVDRDPVALAKARTRAAAQGLAHVRFVEAELESLAAESPFDAVVGRLVLQFLPDPLPILKKLAALVRPGGLIVFHEANWEPFLAHAATLPLRAACAKLLEESFHRSRARTDLPLVLYRGLQDAGFPPPQLTLETPVGDDAGTRRWLGDLIATLYPRFAELGLASEPLGDPNTLAARLDAELDATRSYASCIGLVGAWARKPGA